MAEVTNEELLDALEGVVRQSCSSDQNGVYDSMSLSTYADAMRLLAQAGRMQLTSEYGRRVLGTFR